MKKLSVFTLLCIAILVLAGCTSIGIPFDSKGTISGTIIDDLTKAKLAGVTVSVGDATAQTDADGKYTIEGVKVGTQVVKATLMGYEDAAATVAVMKDMETKCNLSMKMLIGNVSGMVTDALTNKGIEGATVIVGDFTTKTNADGKYTLTVGTGEKEITVKADFYLPETTTIEVGTEEPATYNVSLAQAGMVKGIVTDGQAGPALAGAKVSWGDQSTVTDANGNFALAVNAGAGPFDVLVTKFGRSTTKIQNVKLGFGETVSYNVPNKPAFNPNNAPSVPTVSVNVNPGQVLTGTVPVTITASSPDNLVYLMYAWFGGEQRSPRDVYQSSVDEYTTNFDTTTAPNGDSFIKVLVYDNQDNATLLYVPVKINNTATATKLPADLGNYRVVSYSFGQNIGFYKKGRAAYFASHGLAGDPNVINFPNGGSVDLNAAPGNGTLYVKLSWDAVQDATGYTVSRSFDNVNFTVLGNIKYNTYDDYSPALQVGQETWYRVVPYNSFGNSNGKTYSITPLPVFNIELDQPANNAFNVSLTPTFTWKNVCPEGSFPAGTAFASNITLYDVTSYQIWGQNNIPGQSITLPGVLNPLGIYSWDISVGLAQKVWAKASNLDYSIANSYSGEYKTDSTGKQLTGSGSINGEFVFTTTSGK